MVVNVTILPAVIVGIPNSWYWVDERVLGQLELAYTPAVAVLQVTVALVYSEKVSHGLTAGVTVGCV
jgi:hypothetical protein